MKIEDSKKIGLFIMPRSSKDWRGAEALWITAAGWSAAAENLFGKSFVLTTDRIASPKDILNYPLGLDESKPTKRIKMGKFFPLFFLTLIKDIILWKNSKRKSNFSYKFPFEENEVGFIWEQHDLFPGPGRKLANKLNVPLITYVHAPQVWESSKWGVKRYIWGWLVENFIEAKSLKKSDLIACVSTEVALKLEKMGISKNKILISPMAVDPKLFLKNNYSNEIKESLNLKDKITIGWTGSFRSFHGLDLLVKAFAEVNKLHSSTRLLLVGDGFEMPVIEKLVKDLKIEDIIIFLGRQPFSKIPSYVSAFDIAIVSARSSDGFHYSPLKLREYLAACKPTLAPIAGEIPDLFKHKKTVMLYKAGDVNDMKDKIIELISNPSLSSEIAKNGSDFIISNGTWEVELKKSLSKLNF